MRDGRIARGCSRRQQCGDAEFGDLDFSAGRVDENVLRLDVLVRRRRDDESRRGGRDTDGEFEEEIDTHRRLREALRAVHLRSPRARALRRRPSSRGRWADDRRAVELARDAILVVEPSNVLRVRAASRQMSSGVPAIDLACGSRGAEALGRTVELHSVQSKHSSPGVTHRWPCCARSLPVRPQSGARTPPSPARERRRNRSGGGLVLPRRVFELFHFAQNRLASCWRLTRTDVHVAGEGVAGGVAPARADHGARCWRCSGSAGRARDRTRRPRCSRPAGSPARRRRRAGSPATWRRRSSGTSILFCCCGSSTSSECVESWTFERRRRGRAEREQRPKGVGLGACAEVHAEALAHERVVEHRAVDRAGLDVAVEVQHVVRRRRRRPAWAPCVGGREAHSRRRRASCRTPSESFRQVPVQCRVGVHGPEPEHEAVDRHVLDPVLHHFSRHLGNAIFVADLVLGAALLLLSSSSLQPESTARQAARAS